jgi:hypothetical protein
MLKTKEEEQLERELESDIGSFAKLRGWWYCKFVAPGKRSVPDRLFIRRGRHVFIEVKRFGEEPTRQQLKRHRDMRDHGAEVHWVDNLADAKRILM